MNIRSAGDFWANELFFKNGFSYKADVFVKGHREEPTEGYVVGGFDPTSVSVVEKGHVPSEAFTNAVKGLAERDPADLSRIIIGGWRNEGYGKDYFELSEVFVSKDDAMAVARGRGELAIWDVKNAAVVWVD